MQTNLNKLLYEMLYIQYICLINKSTKLLTGVYTSHILRLAGGWRSPLHNNCSPVRSHDRGTGSFLCEGGIRSHSQRFLQDCSCTLEETNIYIFKYYIGNCSYLGSVSPQHGGLFYWFHSIAWGKGRKWKTAPKRLLDLSLTLFCTKMHPGAYR